MNKREKAYRYLRRFAKVVTVLLLLFVFLILFLRSQWGQGLILDEVVSYMEAQTGTRLDIDKLYITFSGDVALEGLYLEDLQKDTLLYSKSLEADIGLGKILFGNTLEIESLEWNGAIMKIQRPNTSDKFNFDFLLEAFTESGATADETSEEPLNLKIGTLLLENISINYQDEHLGISSENQVGQLLAEIKDIDLELFHFYFEEIKLRNSELSYRQAKPFPDQEASSDSLLPKLGFQKVTIDSLAASYQSIPDGLIVTTRITALATSLPKIDLTNTSYKVGRFMLRDSDIAIETKETASKDQSINTGEPSFAWPDLAINATDMVLQNNRFSLATKSTDTLPTKNSRASWSLSKINLTIPQFQYEPQSAQWDIEELSFQEKDGFQLESFATEGKLTEIAIEFSKLALATNGSALEGTAQLNYASIDQLLNVPENARFKLDLPSYQVDLNDVLAFQPALQSDSLVRAVAKYPIEGQFSAHGALGAITLTDAEARWGTMTSLSLRGTIYNALITDSLRLELDTIKVLSGKTDIDQLGVLQDSVIQLPKNMKLSATATGTLENLTTDLQLATSLGNAVYKGRGGFPKTPFLEGTLQIDSLQLDSFLKNPSLGPTSLTAEINLHGNNLQNLDGHFDALIRQFILNGYTYEELQAAGAINKGMGTVELDYRDENLHFDAGAEFVVEDSNYQVSSEIHLMGADLEALQLAQNTIKVGATIQTEFNGNSDDFTLDSKISEVVTVLNNEQYQTADIDLSAVIRPNTTRARVKSGFLDGDLKANGSPDAISEALLAQWNRYFVDTSNLDINEGKLSVSLNAQLTPEPILTEVFLKGTQRFDTIAMNAKFDAMSQELHAELHAPFVNYQGAIIDSLHVTINGDAENLSFSSGMANLQYEPIQIKKTFFEGTLQNKELLLDFLAYDETKKLMHIASEMQWRDDILSLHINPDALLLNGNLWSIPEKNKITISNTDANFEQVVFSKGNQQLTLSSSIPGNSNEHIGVLFDNFRLQTFLSLLNPDDILISGSAQGKLVLENPFGAKGLLADMTITDLGILENRLGNLSLNASSQSFSDYNLELGIEDGGLDLDLIGSYTAGTEATELDMNLDVKKLETKLVADFFEEELQQAQGFISGKFDVNGTLADPTYQGVISFNDTSLEIVPLNTTFTVTDETIKIDETAVTIDDFLISDAKESSFVIDGTIGTSELTNPSFDLHLKADEFRLLDAAKKDNELYYGIASVDADIEITGDALLPKINGKIRARKVTELTYVIPEEQLDIEERDGVVIFVNKENPNAILTQEENESAPDLFLGYDINLVLELAEDAIFTIVLDEKTRDVLQVAGDAALNLNIDPNGAIGLTGRYELKDGFYRTSLYNLVSRKFDLQPGGTITWQGNPMDAKLDVTAIYRLETSAAPLMASATSGVEASLASKYQQVMPFLVYLNVDGEITAPQLSFDLGIPESARGDLGGAVYGKVQQLNEQETELNKQVFSLLALNRFFPNTTSDGSSGGAAGLARNNVNKVLSGELNAFSEKVLGNSGFDLDFDLDSFTDYTGESAQDRTQLNINAQKKLFNDRLIVTAGSAIDVEGSAQAGQEETPIIGNVSLEYLLTKNGRYRLKGFRKNEYVNVIDGQLILTGLAFIFNRDFNEFSELFNPLNSNQEAPNSKNTKGSKEKPKKKNDEK